MWGILAGYACFAASVHYFIDWRLGDGEHTRFPDVRRSALIFWRYFVLAGLLAGVGALFEIDAMAPLASGTFAASFLASTVLWKSFQAYGGPENAPSPLYRLVAARPHLLVAIGAVLALCVFVLAPDDRTTRRATRLQPSSVVQNHQ